MHRYYCINISSYFYINRASNDFCSGMKSTYQLTSPFSRTQFLYQFSLHLHVGTCRRSRNSTAIDNFFSSWVCAKHDKVSGVIGSCIIRVLENKGAQGTKISTLKEQVRMLNWLMLSFVQSNFCLVWKFARQV